MQEDYSTRTLVKAAAVSNSRTRSCITTGNLPQVPYPGFVHRYSNEASVHRQMWRAACRNVSREIGKLTLRFGQKRSQHAQGRVHPRRGHWLDRNDPGSPRRNYPIESVFYNPVWSLFEGVETEPIRPMSTCRQRKTSMPSTFAREPIRRARRVWTSILVGGEENV